MQPKIGFMGLGIMGTPMAANLLKAGYAVTVSNRSPEKAAPLVKLGATPAATPKALARDADIIIAMVTGPEALGDLLCGPDGAGRGLRPQQGLHQHELGAPRLHPGTGPGTGTHRRHLHRRPGVGHQEAGGGRRPGHPGRRPPGSG